MPCIELEDNFLIIIIRKSYKIDTYVGYIILIQNFNRVIFLGHLIAEIIIFLQKKVNSLKYVILYIIGKKIVFWTLYAIELWPVSFSFSRYWCPNLRKLRHHFSENLKFSKIRNNIYFWKEKIMKIFDF